jgi:hypothetical protein
MIHDSMWRYSVKSIAHHPLTGMCISQYCMLLDAPAVTRSTISPCTSSRVLLDDHRLLPSSGCAMIQLLASMLWSVCMAYEPYRMGGIIVVSNGSQQSVLGRAVDGSSQTVEWYRVSIIMFNDRMHRSKTWCRRDYPSVDGGCSSLAYSYSSADSLPPSCYSTSSSNSRSALPPISLFIQPALSLG